ncbi:hypothetical protein BHM03_00032624 [Ensete ventricosum]|nr:hypothetical protein BHM03_00032624 [Ensete ventricosum]
MRRARQPPLPVGGHCYPWAASPRAGGVTSCDHLVRRGGIPSGLQPWLTAPGLVAFAAKTQQECVEQFYTMQSHHS